MSIASAPINKLRGLNLSKYPIAEINQLFKEFGKYALVRMTLHAGKTIIRARPNESKMFNKVSELSYKPEKFNTTYQRASTPNNTMFYGCVYPDDSKKEEGHSLARQTAIYEVSELYRKDIKSGEEKFTFSNWEVVKDIPLIAIVYHQDFIDISSHTNEMYTAYHSFLLHNSPQDIENSMVVTEYLASEFAKEKTPNDYDYLISALFTEMFTKQGLGGVYYPSVRTKGKGFNVAIHPNFINNMLPIVAGECSHYRKGDSILDNDTLCLIKEGQMEFLLEPIIDTRYHKGRETCYKMLSGEI